MIYVVMINRKEDGYFMMGAFKAWPTVTELMIHFGDLGLPSGFKEEYWEPARIGLERVIEKCKQIQSDACVGFKVKLAQSKKLGDDTIEIMIGSNCDVA